MRSRVALLVLLGIGCSDTEPTARVGQRRLALEFAAEVNEFTTAIGTRAFPNSENPSDPSAWRVVSSEAFDAALDELSGKLSELRESRHFLDGAQLANDGWSAGIYVHQNNWVDSWQVVEGLNWVVLDGARVDPTSGVLFATRYRLVNLPRTLEVPFLGYSPAIFMQLGGVGTDRCCGPSELCDTEGGPENPHCPGGWCDDGTYVHQGSLGIPGMRSATGAPYISAHTYKANFTHKMGCLPVRNDGCYRQTPICDVGILGNPPWGSWNASLPIGSGTCSPPADRPVSGRIVPRDCTYRAEQADSPKAERFIGIAGGHKRPECDGQCYECEQFKSAADSNGRPRQCALFRPLPGDPGGLPGSASSGICTSTAGSAGLEQITLRNAAGLGVGMAGKGGCQTVQNPNAPADYFRICTECSPSQCRKTLERAQSLVANPGSNTNTATTCNATQLTCQPLPTGSGGGGAAGGAPGGGMAGGMGGGSAAGAPVPNPPVTQTTPPPPSQPNRSVPTNRAEPKAATDQKNDQNKSVQRKGEKTGDPVSMASGALELREVDLSFPGAVRPLEFVRAYDSRSRDRSMLGSNWTHNWDVRVVPLNDENRPSWTDPYCAGAPHETTCIMLYVGDTPQLFYREFLTGVYVPQAGVTTATLVPLAVPPGTPDSQTGWLLESADGHNLMFDTDGYLVKDVDRFGNGFTLEYELTASGRLFTALCPRGILEMVPNPSDPQSILMRPQQGPVYAADSLDCRALGSLVGVRAPMARLPSGAPTLHFSLPGGASTQLQQAKTLVESLQNTSGRQPGSPMPWGTRLKRLTSVKEITATTGSTVTATGRALTFEYWGTTAPTLIGTTASLRAEGLLRAVNGPAGARIEYTYHSPESATSHPVFLNEAFLVEARRLDGVAPAGLRATPVRSKQFVYAWAKNTLGASSITKLRTAFADFWAAQSNCTFTPVDNCGSKRPPAMNWMDVTAELADVEATFRTDVVDNIIRVNNGSVVESETRYDVDPFSLSFDRATKQRWGSTSTTQMASTSPDWDTQLPEGRIEWVEAMPISNGQDDATTAFLPAQIASRYGLEQMPAGETLTKARGSGMLLPPGSPDTVVIPGQNPPIAEGTTVPASAAQAAACRNQKLPALRSRLPGYRPSFEYYDLAPQASDPDSATQGIDVTTFKLRRSRLSCDLLARAQTSDARTTDLAWVWQNDGTGQMVANRSLGRRQFITLNANRICAWVADTNREGVVRYVGLNFQGRPLVDAIMGPDNLWRFAETLYNADGNVIAQRKTLPETTLWSNGRGDTRYSYLDTVQPSNPGQPMPWYWARRGNVIKIVERPRGTTVVEHQETAGGATQVTTTGRFTKFEYEPLFNQVRVIKSGWLDSSGAEQLSETTEMTFDYQEGPISNLLPILERQRALGFSWAVDSNFNLLLPQIQSALAVPLGVGDLNGDGTTTLTGLPSLVARRPASGGQEVSAFRWNRGGRLIWTQGSDGATQAQPNVMPTGGPVLEFRYLPLGSFSGVASATNTGFLGSIHHAPRKAWPASQGPSAAPCPHLAGPYQWLLPSTCSSTNLSAQLQSQRFLPAQVADAIVTQQNAQFDGTTTWDYHVTGHVKRVSGPDARAVETDRDLDGRVTTERLFDNGGEFSRSEVTFDALLRPVEVARSGAGTYLGKTVRIFDEEDRLLYECEEFVQGGCVRPGVGLLPADGRSVTNSYTAEGRLSLSLDAEGLATEYLYDPRGWVRATAAYRDTQDGTRTVEFEFDDDGQVTLKKIQGVLLSERRRYDGYGRLEYLQDTQQRWFRVFRSPRETVTRVHVAASQFGPALWYQWFERDAFGRGLKEYTNGTTAAHITSEVQRRPGGQVWWSRSYGRRPTVSTTNADGEVVWSSDVDGEVANVATSMPSSRVVTSSTIRGGSWLTSSTVTELDVLGLPKSVTERGEGTNKAALERTSTFTRNRSGALVRQDAADGKMTEYVVDLAGRLDAIRETVPTTPPTRSTEFSRDRRGAVRRTIDLNAQSTYQDYNSFGQLVRRQTLGHNGTRAITIVATWSYDALGRVNQVSPGSGISYQHRYNTRNQLIAFDQNETGTLRTWTWDDLGRLSAATNNNLGLAALPGQNVVVSTFGYDWLGRVASETSQIGSRPVRSVNSSFTASATAPWQPVSRNTTRPGGSTTVDEFDSLGRQTRLTRGAGITTDFAWMGELMTEQTSQAPSSLVQTLVNFDSLAQPLSWETQLNGSNVLNVSVLRDQVGRIGSYSRQDWRPPSVNTPANTWRGYEYDSMRRVARVHESDQLPNLTNHYTHTFTNMSASTLAGLANAKSWNYQREPTIGSVESITTTGGMERLLVSPRNDGYQLSAYKRTSNEPTRTTVYDTMGRLIDDGNEHYEWSALSELRRAGAESLQYDGLGRLIGRLGIGGGISEEYVYDGAQMVAAFGSGPNAVVWTATWGPGLDNLVSITRGDATFLALGDGRGSIGSYVNESTRRVAATLDYTPEGRVNWRTWDGNGAQTGECDQFKDPELECPSGPNLLPFGFHGAFKSPVTGLVYFRNRWFSTRSGEWLSRDPLGAVDSPNLYAFNAFDAVNRLDLLGLKSKGPAVTTVEFEPQTIEGETSSLQRPGPSRGMVSMAVATQKDIDDARDDWDTFERELQNSLDDMVMFAGGAALGAFEGAVPFGTTMSRNVVGAPKSFVVGRAVGNIIGGIIGMMEGIEIGGGGIAISPGTGGASAVGGVAVAGAFIANGTVSVGRGAGALVDIAVAAVNNNGNGPPGTQTPNPVPPSSSPTPPAASPSPVAPGTPPASPLKPEAKYLRGGKHGLEWKEGRAEAQKTGKPQGQWGSKADLDFGGEKAATLQPGEGRFFPLPAGSKSVVHKPDGTTVPASRIWVRNNGSGTFHGAPWE